MATQHTLREKILIEVRSTTGVRLEELVRTCSEFTWNQVFFEVKADTHGRAAHDERRAIRLYADSDTACISTCREWPSRHCCVADAVGTVNGPTTEGRSIIQLRTNPRRDFSQFRPSDDTRKMS